MRLVVRLLVAAAAFWIVGALLPGVHVRHGFVNYLVVAIIFGIVNALVGPILHLIAFPLTVLTLGLFRLVVNAGLLGITAALTARLAIDGFFWAVLGALVISAVTWGADQTLGIKD
jgi:putative membrane protein